MNNFQAKHQPSVGADLSCPPQMYRPKDKQLRRGGSGAGQSSGLYVRPWGRKGWLIAICLVPLCLGDTALLIVGYQKYSALYAKDMSLAQQGIQQLRTAVTLVEALSHNPFNAPTMQHAQGEFASALTLFVGLDHDLKALPAISASLPIVGTRLNAAEHLLPLVIEGAQAGVMVCTALNLLISRFHNPVDTSGLTMTDFTVVEQHFQYIKTILNQMLGQINSLQPTDLQLDPRIGQFVALVQKDVPALQTWLNEIGQLLPVAPALLGIGTPANYLIEVLDSTELRPAGGFIGNYGIATFSGAKLVATHITDSYLLDTPFVASGHRIPYPKAYNWFDLAPQSWSFRDSNLDADFPTSARNAEQAYHLEGGNVPLQGVIALTPALVARTLAITGPIAVPEYHETVTAQNLVARIHYYQLGPARQGSSLILSPDGTSSQRKHFIALLAEHLLARLHQLPSSAYPNLVQLLVQSLRTKDLQIYCNLTGAEHLLEQAHLDAAIQSAPADSLFIVDANISANKANSLITSTLHDQVTIDAQGSAVHHTTISYAWTINGQLYGPSVYRDYVRVYVPPASILQVQQGWQPRATSEAFGRQVWAGFFTLTFGHTLTITLLWTIPGVARQAHNGWEYQYLIQRQAGAQWTLSVQIKLPSCAVMTASSPSLWTGTRPPTPTNGTQEVASLAESLIQDINLELDYTCQEQPSEEKS